MAQQVIELAGGIVRNLPDNRVADGTMQEIINMRPKDGAWRPVGPKEAVANADLTDILFIHTIDEETKVYIGKEFDSPLYYLNYVVYVNGVANGAAARLFTIGENDELLFGPLHRSLLISNITRAKMPVIVFDPTSLTYKVFEDGWPELPTMTYSSVELDPIPGSPEIVEDSAEEMLASVLAAIAENNKYSITGPVAYRFAWELVDGTLVKHSSPFDVIASYLETTNTSPATTTLRLMAPMWSASMTPELYEALYEPWKGIIRSFNVYATRQQTPVIGYTNYKPVFDDIDLKTEQYYLIDSIPLDDGFAVHMNLIGWWGENFEDLEVRPSMTTDNFSHHALFAKSMFPYNNRIFLGDIGVTMYEGPNPSACIESDLSGGSSTYNVYFQVDLHTQSGVMTVETHFNTFPLSTVNGVVTFNLKRYYSYPDARAKTLRIYIYKTGVWYLVSSLSLTANEMLNFALFYDGYGQNADGRIISGVYEFSDELAAYEVTGRQALNLTYYDQNRVQLTELSNPFVYPAINSYRIGNGRIVGMSSNSVALSQGQFGQFPVYCFTTDGIWTMNIGDGDPLITNIVPLSREVCNNARSITMIDGGTVFSTDKGLLILTGVVPFEISTLAEGQYLSRLTGTVNYEAIANNPNLYQVRNFLCSTDILTYIAGANLAWDYINKEIIVCNPSYNYSWVYSLTHKVWFKISEVWIRFIPDFPRVYGYREIIVNAVTTPYMCEVSEEDFTGMITIHMETRPLKLSPRAYKKLNRMIIGGNLNDSLDHPFSVNLFGSADRIIWYLLNASKTFSEKSRLIIGRSTHSCQYYILVIGGQVDEEAYFTHIEVDYEERYTDKLR